MGYSQFRHVRTQQILKKIELIKPYKANLY